MAELQYRTYQQLLDATLSRLSLYDDNNLIIPSRYIRTARRCNATLGLMLNRKREQTVEVDNYRADIPDDCLTILALGVPMQGCYTIPRPTNRCLNKFSQDSINRTSYNPVYQVDVDDNQLLFNIQDGEASLYYLCHMEDENGNLLVLDHDYTNDYYEWAMMEDIFTDLWHNNDADVQNKLIDARQQHQIQKTRAKVFVSTPEYTKMKEYTRQKEQAYYDKYFKPIL